MDDVTRQNYHCHKTTYNMCISKRHGRKKNKSINDLAITLNSNRPRPLYKYYFTCRQCLYNCSTLSSSILFNWAIMWLHIHVGVSELGVMTITSIALIAVIQLHYYHIYVYNTAVYKI